MAIPIPLIIGFIAILGAGVFITVNGNKPKKPGSSSKKYKAWIKLYIRFESFPLTTNSIHKISKELQSLSVYHVRDVYVKTAQMFLKGSGTVLAIVAAAAVLFDDMIAVLMCGTLALSIYTSSIEKKVTAVANVTFAIK